MNISVSSHCDRLARRVSRAVRYYRTLGSLTQAELAQRAGVTAETVARLERVVRGAPSANSNPSLETLGRLSFALGVETSELLLGAAASKHTGSSVEKFFKEESARFAKTRLAKAKARAKRIGKRS